MNNTTLTLAPNDAGPIPDPRHLDLLPQREACAETVARIVLSAALVRVREGVL